MSEQPSFGGFPQIDANYTMCPNVFFDRIVGYYEPCVVNVVAILIRETLGWLNQHSKGRKIEAELPLSAFVKHGMSQESARKGLKLAAAAGFLIKTEAASPKDPARYALRWEDPKTQKEAIKEERRAFQARKTRAGGLRDNFSKRRVLDSRVLKSSTLKSSTPEIRTPYNKESLKKSFPEKKEEELNSLASHLPEEEGREALASAHSVPAVSTWSTLPEPDQRPWLEQARRELVLIHTGSGITPKPKLIEVRARNLYEKSLNEKSLSEKSLNEKSLSELSPKGSQ